MLKIFHFYADWSQECEIQNSVLEELSQDYDDITVELVNVDYQEAMAKKYEILTIPTLIIEVDTELVSKVEGLVELEELEEIIDEVFSEDDEEDDDFWESPAPI